MSHGAVQFGVGQGCRTFPPTQDRRTPSTGAQLALAWLVQPLIRHSKVSPTVSMRPAPPTVDVRERMLVVPPVGQNVQVGGGEHVE